MLANDVRLTGLVPCACSAWHNETATHVCGLYACCPADTGTEGVCAQEKTHARPAPMASQQSASRSGTGDCMAAPGQFGLDTRAYTWLGVGLMAQRHIPAL